MASEYPTPWMTYLINFHKHSSSPLALDCMAAGFVLKVWTETWYKVTHIAIRCSRQRMNALSSLSNLFRSAIVALGGGSAGGSKSNPPTKDVLSAVDLEAV